MRQKTDERAYRHWIELIIHIDCGFMMHVYGWNGRTNQVFMSEDRRDILQSARARYNLLMGLPLYCEINLGFVDLKVRRVSKLVNWSGTRRRKDYMEQ